MTTLYHDDVLLDPCSKITIVILFGPILGSVGLLLNLLPVTRKRWTSFCKLYRVTE